MPKPVYHLRDTLLSTRTLCGRTTTPRYRFVDINQIADHHAACPLCLARAVRLGMVVSDNPLQDDFTEKRHNDWLMRLGVTQYN